MEMLHISETKLNCSHLAHIFLKCKKITELSLTISQKDLKINNNSLKGREEDALQLSCLKDCKDKLQNLVKLEITVFHSSLQEGMLFVRYNISKCFILFCT